MYFFTFDALQVELEVSAIHEMSANLLTIPSSPHIHTSLPNKFKEKGIGFSVMKFKENSKPQQVPCTKS